MKLLASQFAYLFTTREMQGNLRSLLKYLGLVAAIITLYAAVFHLIMVRVEGQSHSWITGLYWTLTVMTTLGFGDITFTSDMGRLFSIVVLLSGVILLLVMLPFLLIRLFYAPWLEAKMRTHVARRLPEDATQHVILTHYDAVAVGLIARLGTERIPYCVIEPDPAAAAVLAADAVNVVAGDIDSRATYERVNVTSARLVLANCADTTNTNITLSIREVSPTVPIVAIAESKDSVDILELSGATRVLCLKHELGEYLANRVSVARAEAHIIGHFRELGIAELPVVGTSFAGRMVRDTRLRETCGLNLVGVWERGRLRPAYPHTVISAQGVIVVVGTEAQIRVLNRLLPDHKEPGHPVIVIGAGKVGDAAARALRRKGVPVHVVDRESRAIEGLEGVVDGIFVGDAADRAVLERAGLEHAPSVLLTTNDDAMNIYLAVYCRRLNADLRIVSRITHERNVEAIHRAGADFVLSYASLGVEAVLSVLRGHEPVILGEGVDLFMLPVPRSLEGRTLRETEIGSRTGLSVVAIQQDGHLVTHLSADMRVGVGAEFVMLGGLEQRRAFVQAFG